MAKQIGVLVFPAGEVNSVELHGALATCVNIKLYGGSSVDRHGPYIFKNYITGIPFINDEKFITEFNNLLKKHEIDVIFPTHDAVAVFLVDNQDKINAKIIAGDKKTSAICRDKQLMYELFANHRFAPKLYKDTDKIDLPVFIKPKIGAGSVGAVKIETKEDLANVNFAENVVSEYLPGEEYTVDCLTDKDGKLVLASPRSRDRTLAGISVSGQSQPLTEDIKHMAETINKELSFMGLWFFQIKKDTQGKFKLLEVSTRCAGTMCLTRARGANLPLLSVYAAMGMDVGVFLNPYNVTVDRTLINRYKIDYQYDTVYLDFDDTVIIDGKAHLYAMMFIYQCQNAGKKIYLVTRHAKDIYETLAKHNIDKNLFAEIIHMDEKTAKIDHVKPEKAIFIDNAYQERKFVYDKYKIPVFDVDAIEVLLDWRT